MLGFLSGATGIPRRAGDVLQSVKVLFRCFVEFPDELHIPTKSASHYDLKCDQVYRTGSGGDARIVDKFSAIEKTHSKIETENWGSAVQLHVKDDPLKLDTLLS